MRRAARLLCPWLAARPDSEHAPKHVVALDEVVPQRARNMYEHDGSKDVGQDFVRVLQNTVHRPTFEGTQVNLKRRAVSTRCSRYMPPISISC